MPRRLAACFLVSAALLAGCPDVACASGAEVSPALVGRLPEEVALDCGQSSSMAADVRFLQQSVEHLP